MSTMSMVNDFDLNFLPESERSPSFTEGSNRAQLLDLDIDLENVSDEEIYNQGQSELPDLNIDLENDMDEEVSHQGSEEIVRSTSNQNQSTDTTSEFDDAQTTKKTMLTNDERHAIHLALMTESVNGQFRRGALTNISNMYSVSRRTISRIWNLTKNGLDVNHRKMKNCGRKRIEIDREEFQRVPLSKRTCLRSLSCAVKIIPLTLSRNVRSGNIRRHTNTIKPSLKESNKKDRVQFCLSMIDKNSMPHEPRFMDMNNVIHIDEKWFYISKNCEKFYLLPEEHEPLRTCKSKNFLTKVMFLAAIARPRFDSDGNETFSGKIGIFPFVIEEPAKRSSINRVAGTLETKAITSVGRDISRSYLINKVLPTILEKWPNIGGNIVIYIQQDNARTHIHPDDEEFRLAVARCGLNVHLFCQPPNSPDLNVLDLGFFSVIQSLQQNQASRTIDELILTVQKSFDEFSSNKSNHIFITLQQCMIKIMKIRGSNDYKIPHMNKNSLERKGELPHQLQCDAKMVEEVIEWLNTSEDVPIR